MDYRWAKLPVPGLGGAAGALVGDGAALGLHAAMSGRDMTPTQARSMLRRDT